MHFSLKLKNYLFIIGLLISLKGLNQQQSNYDTLNLDDSTELLDLIDLSKKIFRKQQQGAVKKIKPEKKFEFSVLPVIGYTLQSGLVANVSGNVVFKNGTNDSTNTSALVQGISYSEYNQLEFYLQSEIWSKNNKWNFNGDLRFYIYPQDTYGLGGFSKEHEAILVNFSFIRFYGTVFRKIKHNLYFGLGYMLDKRWNIVQSPHNFISDYDKYGYRSTSNSSGFNINILADTRDNPINSQKGFYSNAILRFNKKFLGSDSDWTSFMLDYRKYFKLDHKHTTLAFWNMYWLTLSGNPPYLDLPSTGWDTNNNLGRGYIQSRFRSPNLIYLESELRFNITRNQFLGAVVFANAQSFTEIGSKKFERIIPGFGTGIRLKFNKDSRTNLAIDYGFGIDGSGGIFVNLGEVF
ncbi:MAG: BamA/TamA family outer membrane protein [Chitinophagaceae bacterium]|nr:BamA/TamA family outer membrane protein [Chitinophagaceae bacterium]